MAWEIKGKVILITGAGGGIGSCSAKELLRQGAKGVALADISTNLGQKALKEIEEEFGVGRAIFIKTDVTVSVQFREAFKKTIEQFKNIDVLINSAGYFKETLWEREIAVNVNGTINGMILGLHEYLPKYKQGETGAILNLSSVVGLNEFSAVPVYTAAKFAVHGLTRAWGDQAHFQKTKIKVIGICPGATDTDLMKPAMEDGVLLSEHYREIMSNELTKFVFQTPEKLAEAICEILRNAKTGTIWVAEASNPAYEYILPDRESFNPYSDHVST